MPTQKDQSTEEKIKIAAQKIFLEKGFSATKTRDIAEAADINLALLNYYFRSKKGLFDLIMMENLQRFFGSILTILNNPNTTIADKITAFVEHYIDLLKEDHNVALFIITEVRNNPSDFVKTMQLREKIQATYFVKQFENVGDFNQLLPINPLHILMNLSSMIIFPFIASPIMIEVFGSEKSTFDQLMEERKKLIPQWIEAMLTTSSSPSELK